MADYKFTVENWAFFYSPGPNRCTIFTDAPNSACFHQTSYGEQDDHCMCPASIALKNSWIYYDIAEYGCFVGTREAQECLNFLCFRHFNLGFNALLTSK